MSIHKIILSRDMVNQMILEIQSLIFEFHEEREYDYKSHMSILDFVIEISEIIEAGGYNYDGRASRWVLEVSIEQLKETKETVLETFFKSKKLNEREKSIKQKLEYLVWGKFQREINLIEILNDANNQA